MSLQKSNWCHVVGSFSAMCIFDSICIFRKYKNSKNNKKRNKIIIIINYGILIKNLVLNENNYG